MIDPIETPFFKAAMAAAEWITDELHPKDWGDMPPQQIYDTIYPLEYITAPGRTRPELPDGVSATWRLLRDDEGNVYWHRVE